MPQRRSTTWTFARVGWVVASAGLWALTPQVVAQDEAQAPAADEAAPRAQARPSDQQLLEDFTFYVNIANIELAKANAQALLDRQLSPQAFLGMVEDSATTQDRFDRAYRRALLIPDLEDLSARLFRLYEDGRLARARDPNEIARNLALLTGGARGQLLARQRLVAAGEYAVPQLLEVIQDRQDSALSTEVERVLRDMGSHAVAPLSTALLGVDEVTQETIARVLGRLGYRTALPYLVELLSTTGNPSVRAEAEQAVRALGGDSRVSVAGLYRELAADYYAEPRSLTPFASEANQLLWTYRPELGLNPTAIVTEVFHEARAMELAERTLKLDSADQEAIALWLAANFSREIDQPAGYENPAYPAERRDAMYFAIAAGAPAMQRVLDWALVDRDTPLARKAIAALARSAGESGLGAGAGRGLVQALSYPDRRVRAEAAIAIGRARPAQYFEGAERVVPILAGVIRDGGRRIAAVLASPLERQQQIRAVLEAIGYEVLQPGIQLADLQDALATTPGVDILVCDLTSEATAEVIDQVRRSSKLGATPVLALMTPPGLAQFAGRFDEDRLTRLARQGVSDEQLTAGITQLVELATGEPVTDDEAQAYADAALDVLHDLAVASRTGGSAPFDVGDAAGPLVEALGVADGPMKQKVAQVLASIGQQRAQVALLDAAMSASGEDRTALLERGIESAKRFGNLLAPRQVDWLLGLASSADEAEATVAAALMGALNLPNQELVPLILGQKP